MKNGTNYSSESLRWYLSMESRGPSLDPDRDAGEGWTKQLIFFQLEKKSHLKDTVSQLNINGILTHDPRSSAGYCASFYSSRYESRFNEKDTSDFLDSLNNTKSKVKTKQRCDNSVCIEGVSHAVKELKLNNPLVRMD